MVRLYNGDCLEIMKNIADESVDLILADPPYGTTACKWDCVIPFDKMWEQINRVIKPNGAIVLFGSEPFSSALRMSNIKNYKYDWYWKKGNAKTGFLNAHRLPMSAIETISVFINGKFWYKPQGLRPCNKKVTRASIGKTYQKGRNSNLSNSQEFENYPVNLINFSRDKEKLHPTQKPVALLEYLIRTYTNEGELVLDFVMGSGSTAIACLNTNRDFIGIELDKNYFDIAKNRIEEAKSND